MHRQQAIMQRTTGTISSGAHPGSYNGQDAYNDMLVVDNGHSDGIGTSERSRNDRGGTTLNASHEQPILKQESKTAVRRLTPLECERLQGMPDDWSKYGVDENGNIYELSDSARYRIQGNGIATPFWRWLLLRISAQYERPATLGSLFDGQGSFPMIWENINGKGTAVWSSEIEKNAEAVARYHFPDTSKEE